MGWMGWWCWGSGVGWGDLVANLLTALIAHQTRRHGHLLNMPWVHHQCNIQSAANISSAWVLPSCGHVILLRFSHKLINRPIRLKYNADIKLNCEFCT